MTVQKNKLDFTPRGSNKIHGFHKSLYHDVINVTCHSCDHNGNCLISYKCPTLRKILHILFPNPHQLRGLGIIEQEKLKRRDNPCPK